MLTKAQSKYIRSLSQQKYRKEYNHFVAEGDKIAKEWLSSGADVNKIVATESWIDNNASIIDKHTEAELIPVQPHELSAISSLRTANEVLLVVSMPLVKPYKYTKEWVLALDAIQDPGNMGTIIRIADWFGIKKMIVSEGCVDVYNPKVVQGAMGSHLRVEIYNENLPLVLSSVNCPIYAAVLGGDNIMNLKTPDIGIIIIGNEAKGISEEVANYATHKVMIPGKGGAESLNAGVSAGIICALLTAS